jgi:hypothetical protein
MITLKQWMEVCNYRITEGGDYTPDNLRIYSLESWNGEQSGHSLFIGFDTNTQIVYIVEAHDYKNERSYRFVNPEFKHVSAFVDKCAYDGVDFIDLEVEEDWISKASAIVAGEDYDTRVSIPVEFTDEELLKYMKMAHDQDMKFNDFVEQALREMIDRLKTSDSKYANI